MTSKQDTPFGWDHMATMCVIVLFIGFVLGICFRQANIDGEPCRYGASPRMVTEQDGKHRIVCGCGP